MAAPTGPSYPATLALDAPLTVARWKPLLAWLAAIPHFVVAYALQIVGEVLAIVSWFAIVFTGKVPQGIVELQCMCLRYQMRAQTYAMFLYDPYPPFTFATTPADPGDLPGLRIDYAPSLVDRNRVTTFFRLILVIPHLIAVAVLFIGVFVCMVIGFFAVLFTGSWPEGVRGFIVKVLGWNVRLMAYMYLLTDEYPPFSLD